MWQPTQFHGGVGVMAAAAAVRTSPHRKQAVRERKLCAWQPGQRQSPGRTRSLVLPMMEPPTVGFGASHVIQCVLRAKLCVPQAHDQSPGLMLVGAGPSRGRWQPKHCDRDAKLEKPQTQRQSPLLGSFAVHMGEVLWNAPGVSGAEEVGNSGWKRPEKRSGRNAGGCCCCACCSRSRLWSVAMPRITSMMGAMRPEKPICLIMYEDIFPFLSVLFWLD